jgi:hypothetical protein
LVACWLIGSKRRYAFLIGLVGNLVWIVYVVTSASAHGLLLVCIPMAGINIRNFLKWGKSRAVDIRLDGKQDYGQNRCVVSAIDGKVASDVACYEGNTRQVAGTAHQ